MFGIIKLSAKGNRRAGNRLKEIFLTILLSIFTLSGTASADWEMNHSIPQTTSLYAVWGSTAYDVFVAGSSGVIMHYDGTSWVVMSTGVTNRLTDIWGTASNDVFAVGDNGVILHYDGVSWTAMTSGTSSILNSIWGSASDDVFIAGGGILHYDGSTWTDIGLIESETPGIYFGISGKSIWGSASSDVFVAAFSGDIRHYNGTGWSDISPTVKKPIYDIWGTAYNDVFAVGDNGVILHYDGASWRSMESGTTNTLISIWGTASNDVFAVGSGVILHYDGASWTSMESGTLQMLNSIWGTASNDVYAVSNTGEVLHFTGDNNEPITSVTPAGGVYNTAQSVTLNCDDGTGSGCAATYYTTDGITPTADSAKYSSAISISDNTVLNYFSVDNFGNSETVKTESYIFDTIPPTTTPSVPGGSYQSIQTVELACDDGTGSGCKKTYYTKDGSEPTTASSLYSFAISISSTTNLKYFSVDNAGNSEMPKTENYKINNESASTDAATGGCFIATAAYGNYLDPHVETLRGFRDQVLLTSEAGRIFVDLYYTYSPEVADIIEESPGLRSAVRLGLTPLVFGLENPKQAGLLSLILAFSFGTLAYRRQN